MANKEIKTNAKTKAQIIFGRKVPTFVVLLIIAALLLVFIVSFSLGRFSLTPEQLLVGIYNHFFNAEYVANNLEAGQIDVVIFNNRLPRILMVMLVGAALASAGAAYQGMFKNPLVSPDILGASAGAGLGACVMMLFDMPNVMIQVGAFCGGLMAVGMAVWLNRLVKYDAVLGLVLGGILVSTLFQSGMSIVKLVADVDSKLPTITFWLMGSFSRVLNEDLALAILPLACGFGLLLLQGWRLNVLSFGDEEARSMGVNTRLTRLLVIIAATLLSSISVAVAGIIGWIGLVIPHLARAIVGPNYRVLLPVSMLIGGAYLLIVDNFARLLTTFEIPIGILTAFLGVPFFVVIFRHNMKGWR